MGKLERQAERCVVGKGDVGGVIEDRQYLVDIYAERSLFMSNISF